MTDNEEQAAKEHKRAEKRTDVEAKQSARYQVIMKTNLNSEKLIENTSRANKIKRAEKLAIRENALLGRYEAIKNADLLREYVLKKIKKRKLM